MGFHTGDSDALKAVVESLSDISTHLSEIDDHFSDSIVQQKRIADSLELLVKTLNVAQPTQQNVEQAVSQAVNNGEENKQDLWNVEVWSTARGVCIATYNSDEPPRIHETICLDDFIYIMTDVSMNPSTRKARVKVVSYEEFTNVPLGEKDANE